MTLAGASPGSPERAATAQQVAVVCESTASLPAELREQLHVQVIPIPFVLDGRDYLDDQTIGPDEFYARLGQARGPMLTSPPSPGAYLNAWEAALRTSEGVVLVTVASRLSTFQRSVQVAQQMLVERGEGGRLEVVDSRSAGMGQGFVVMAAARAAAEGLPLGEVAARARGMSTRVQLIVALDTLRYLARTSHLRQVAMLLGPLLDLKPVIRVADGNVRLLGRVRTRRRAEDQLLEQIVRAIPRGARAHIAVQHTAAPEAAQALADRLLQSVDCAELFISPFTPVMGGYCGPGLVGAAFWTESAGPPANAPSAPA